MADMYKAWAAELPTSQPVPPKFNICGNHEKQKQKGKKVGKSERIQIMRLPLMCMKTDEWEGNNFLPNDL